MKNECNCNIIHQEIVDYVNNNMPDNTTLTVLTNFYKSFGDQTRLKILIALSHKEMCGCDIANLLNMTQSAISHQLRYLKEARLVKSRRAGKIVYFSLDDNHVVDILQLGIDHIGEVL